LEEEKERLRGYPDDQQKGTGCHSQHDERAEMVTVRLPAQGAFFFHTKKVCNSETNGCPIQIDYRGGN
jgi:hypothetical protein